MDDKEK
jgi:hypothetical protein